MTSLSQKSINNSLTRANSPEIVDFSSLDFSGAVDIISNSSYTCPTDGVLILACFNAYIEYSSDKISTISNLLFYACFGTSNTVTSTQYRVSKGEILTQNSVGTTNNFVFFVPLKGV